jgi:hypothetical protein
MSITMTRGCRRLCTVSMHWPSCHASSPHNVFMTVPSGFVTGLPGEILFPTNTTRRPVGSEVAPASLITASIPASSSLPPILVGALEFPIDERREATFEQFQPLPTRS